MTMRIGLATCSAVPDLDPDDRLLARALSAAGATVEVVIWDDTEVDWAAYELVVVRSTWDYTSRRDDFLAWTRAVPRLANHADILAWNTDKHYLLGLAAAGLPVVPTTLFEPGVAVNLPATGRHVLKPAIGAGSIDAGYFDLNDELERTSARQHAARLLSAGRSVVLQPYQSRVEESGETALIFVGGEYSHAVRKAAMLGRARSAEAGGLYLAETISAIDAGPDQVALAQAVLTACSARGEVAYARVDLVPGDDDEPLLMEVELTEPSLFLGTAPGSAARLAEVLLQMAS
jgi:hypothetical protein